MQLAKSFISTNDKHYFISTINRESSAALAYGHIYAETIAWEWNPETETRGKIVWQDEACKDSLVAHNRAVDLIESGGLEECNT